eukprot:6177180-Pleurochrysis_carterae.AAC.3
MPTRKKARTSGKSVCTCGKTIESEPRVDARRREAVACCKGLRCRQTQRGSHMIALCPCALNARPHIRKLHPGAPNPRPANPPQ